LGISRLVRAFVIKTTIQIKNIRFFKQIKRHNKNTVPAITTRNNKGTFRLRPPIQKEKPKQTSYHRMQFSATQVFTSLAMVAALANSLVPTPRPQDYGHETLTTLAAREDQSPTDVAQVTARHHELFDFNKSATPYMVIDNSTKNVECNCSSDPFSTRRCNAAAGSLGLVTRGIAVATAGKFLRFCPLFLA
jgi:hypothetical protein